MFASLPPGRSSVTTGVQAALAAAAGQPAPLSVAGGITLVVAG